MKKALLVSIYGVADTGKKTHVRQLKRVLSQNFMEKEKRKVRVAAVSYPVYEIKPSGEKIQDYLSKKNPGNITPLEFQRLNAINKVHFEKEELGKFLAENDIVVTKMYTGTSIACGMADGISKRTMLNLNAGLIEPDISILLKSEKFAESLKAGHIYRNSLEKMKKVYDAYLELAAEFGWHIIDADRSLHEVSDDIFSIISQNLVGMLAV